MKKQSTTIVAVLIIFLVVGTIAGFIYAKQRNQNKPLTVNNVCFLKVDTSPTTKGVTSVKASLYSNGKVGGQLDIVEANKDTITGPFVGTWKSSAAATGLNVVQTYVVQGKVATSSRLIIINEEYAQMGEIKIPKVACE